MSDSFSFPALPKPKPLTQDARGTGPAQPLPPTNPLLAGATVTDRSGGGAANGGSSGTLGLRAAGSMAAPPPRRKVPFEKGFSQMDWVRLTQTHPDLAGLGPGGRPRRGITLEEVSQHSSPDDCWTVLRGKVYNLTPYLRFHPGGVPLLLKVAGKDGTALFNKYHAWVNYEFLLAKCLVGLLAPPSSSGGSDAAAAAAAGAGEHGGRAAAAANGSDAAAAAGGGPQRPDGGSAGDGGAGSQPPGKL